MTTLAADTARTYEKGTIGAMGVIASDIIFEGSAVGENGSGYARPLVAGDPFLGFCEAKVDNSAGAAGALNVRYETKGKIKLAVTSAAITDVGRPVYASDDATFAMTGIGTYIGKIVRYVSSGVAIVEFDASLGEDTYVLDIPIALAGVTAADVLTDLPLGHNGRIVSLDFSVDVPVTTAAKAASLHAEIGAATLTGGVVALTSANCTPLGAVVADTAITAGAGFVAGDTLSIVAASVTAFIEGSGTLHVTIGR